MKKTTFYGSLSALLLVLNMCVVGEYAAPIIKITENYPLLSSVIGDILVFMPPAIIYFIISKTKPSAMCEVFLLRDPGVKNIILIVFMSILIQPFLMFISGISSLFFTNAATEYLESMQDTPALSMLIMTSLAPAVFEELYFRGIVFSGFKNLNIFLACIICGLLFGMAHLHPQQFLYAFIMGTIFCYFVYMTGSVFASILSHFVINSTQTILAVLAYKVTPVETETTVTATFADFLPILYTSVLFLIPFLVCLYYFHYGNEKNMRLRKSETITSENTKIITWPLIITTGIFILYCYSI